MKAIKICCENCEFFEKQEMDDSGRDGVCHRYPPTSLIDQDGDFFFISPEVFLTEKCGEFVPATTRDLVSDEE